MDGSQPLATNYFGERSLENIPYRPLPRHDTRVDGSIGRYAKLAIPAVAAKRGHASLPTDDRFATPELPNLRDAHIADAEILQKSLRALDRRFSLLEPDYSTPLPIRRLRFAIVRA
jgi:hypothetical protein